jgi:hypothetical protein
LKNVTINGRYAGLRPPVASHIILIGDCVDHVTHLEGLAPLLVGTAEALELVFGYLVVVVVKDGVMFEDELNTVEKLLVIDAYLEEVDEDQHVGFEHLTYHVKVL